MYNDSSNFGGNSSELKNYAAFIEKTSKIAAIAIGVGGAVAGFFTHGVMGGVAGLIAGGAVGFAVVTIGDNFSKVLTAIGDVSDNVNANAVKLNAIDKKLDETAADLADTLKKELKNIQVTAAPAEAKAEPKAEKKADVKTESKNESKTEAKAPAKAEVKEEPKEEKKAAPAPVAKKEEPKVEEPKAAGNDPEEKKDDEPEAPKKNITFIPTPMAVKEEPKSPFASADAPSPFAKKKDSPKAEASKDDAPKTETKKAAPAKKSSLYKCEVCGNMVNATPCPRCAAKGKSAPAETKPEAEAEPEVKEEKNTGIWAAATRPATANDLASKASAFKKKEEPAAEPAPAPEAPTETKDEAKVEAKPEVKDEPKASPFSNPKTIEKKPAATTAATPAKKSTLYRCNECGHMVNATPCPRCAIKKKKAAMAGEDVPAPEQPKEEESNEEVNPIWAAAIKPDGTFGGGGSKLMDGGKTIAPTWTSPLKAGDTATEAPSWAKPAPGVAEAQPKEEEVFETVQMPNHNKAPEAPNRPVWEMPKDQPTTTDGAKPGWMQ